MEMDKQGYIYFCTERGVYRYTGMNMEQISLGCYSNACYINLLKDKSGALWLLPYNSPLIRYLPNNPLFINNQYSNKPDSYKHPTLLYGFQDGASSFNFLSSWGNDYKLNSFKGLEQEDTHVDFYKKFIEKKIGKGIEADSLRRVVLNELKEPNIYWNLIRIHQQRYLLVRHLIYDLETGKPVLLVDMKKLGIKGFVTSVFEKNNRLWVAVMGADGGLYRFEKQSGGQPYQLIGKEFDKDNATGVLEDKYNNLWITTFSKGIFQKTYKANFVSELELNDSINIAQLSVLKDNNSIIASDLKTNLWLINWQTGSLKQLYSGNSFTNGAAQLIKRPLSQHYEYYSFDGRRMEFDEAGKLIDKRIGVPFVWTTKYSLVNPEGAYLISNRAVTFIDNINGKWRRYCLPQKPLSVSNIGDTLMLVNTGECLYRLLPDTALLYVNFKLAEGQNIDFVGNGYDHLLLLISDRLYTFSQQHTLKELYKIPENQLLTTVLPYKGGYLCLLINGLQFIDKNGALIGSYFLPDNALKNKISSYQLVNDLFFVSDGHSIFQIDLEHILNSYRHPECKAVLCRLNNKTIANDSNLTIEYKPNQSLILNYHFFETLNKANIFYTLNNEDGQILIKEQINDRRISINNLLPGSYTLLLYVPGNDGKVYSFKRFITVLPQWYQKHSWQLLIFLLMFGLLIWCIWICWSYVYQKRIANMVIKGQLLHLESKSRLNQLKPHFIFNALIPLQHHILMKNEDKALTYLDDFSQLMRKMLEMSAQDTISLKNEIDFLNKYLLIQQAEQSYSFQFSITTELSELEMFSIKIPNLLLHPLIENAIMHGLSNNKKKEGHIDIHLSKKDQYLSIRIANNSKKMLEQYIVKLMKGHALHIIQERIALMNTKKDPNVGLFFETNETNFVAKIILLVDES